MASSTVLAATTAAQPGTVNARQEQEKRAAGKAAPEIDQETGQMINPHNPSFITNAPWYLAQEGSSLKHQKNWKNSRLTGGPDVGSSMDHWYQRGTKGDVKTKFVKGACRNCGALTHTEKDCTERPRAKKAQFTGEDLAPDEFVAGDDLQFDWATKRDRWNGFQANDYTRDVVEQHALREEVKQRKREKEQKQALAQKKLKKKQKEERRLKRQLENGGGSDRQQQDPRKQDGDSDSDSDYDSDLDSDGGDRQKGFENDGTMSTKDNRERSTTRNLRIREDTAKYLLNLDVNSAYYDPKSRAMRANPFDGLGEDEQGFYRGDNFVRSTGEAPEVIARQAFTWEAYKHGVQEIHDQAAPTQAARMHEEYKKRKEEQKHAKRNALLDKYGGREHLDMNPALIFAQTSDYQEYSRSGRVLMERKRTLLKSAYDEDVLEGSHTSVWGSWFDISTGKWGFACCRSANRMDSDCKGLPLEIQNALAAAAAEVKAAAVEDAKTTGETAAAAAEPKGTVLAIEAGLGAAGGKLPPIAEGSEEEENEQEAALGKFRGEKRNDAAAKQSSVVAVAASAAPRQPSDEAAAARQPPAAAASRDDHDVIICQPVPPARVVIEPPPPVEDLPASTEADGGLSFFAKDSPAAATATANAKKEEQKKAPKTKKRKRDTSSSSSSSSSSSDSDSGSSRSSSSSSDSEDRRKKSKKTAKKKKAKRKNSSDSSGSSSSEDKKKKKRGRSKKPRKKQKKEESGPGEVAISIPGAIKTKRLEAKSGIQSGLGVNEDEMDEYRKTNLRAADPMAHLM